MMKELTGNEIEIVSGGNMVLVAGMTALGLGALALGIYAGHQIGQALEPSC